MFNFFSKSKKVTDLSWLGVDMHSHILPGIDDGSPNLETSLRFVKAFENFGLTKLICTPHIYKDLYPNTPETIAAAKSLLQDSMTKNGYAIELGAAAEYMMDQDFTTSNNLVALPNNHLLVEMSYLNESPNVKQTLFDLQIGGYRPILAHPERYIFYFNDMTKLKRFKEKGILFQLNLLSITGYYGKQVKHLAEALIKENYYELAGTDLHHQKHLDVLTEAVQSGKLYASLKNCHLKNKDIF